MAYLSGIEQVPREAFALFAFPEHEVSQRPSQQTSSNSKDSRQDVPHNAISLTHFMQQLGCNPTRVIRTRNNSNCDVCGYTHTSTSNIGSDDSLNSRACTCNQSPGENESPTKNELRNKGDKEDKEEPINWGKGSKDRAKNDKGDTENNSKRKGNEDRPGKEGDGDKSTGKGNGDRSGKNCGCGGDKGPDKGSSGSDRGWRVRPGKVPDSMVIVIFIILGLISAFISGGGDSFLKRIGLSSPDCAVSDNILNFLDKAGTKGAEAESGGVNLGTYQQLDVPAHLDERLVELKKDIRNKKKCLRPYGVDSSCEAGLVNYAAVMTGGSIESVGNTEVLPCPMTCRCMDSKLFKRICIPGEGECSSCTCETFHADTLITPEGNVLSVKCWAFRGVGELEIRLFYPLIIVAVTIHHPAKSILPPGYFKSAPKDIELWGISDELDKEPYHFGAFQYTEDGGSTQIFEVPKPSATFYPRVKFNFTTNHGNPNYTAVYKLEVHGLTDM